MRTLARRVIYMRAKNLLELLSSNHAGDGFYITTILTYPPLSHYTTITIFTIIYHITYPDAVPAGSTNMIATRSMG